MVKRIVCLANSFKTKGYCVAGRELFADGRVGGWIRPVSARPTQEVTHAESWCGGGPPKLLDVIDIPLAKHVPHFHQTENFEFEPGRPWKKVGAMTAAQLARMVEHPKVLWANTQHTHFGKNDCLTETEAQAFHRSLLLLALDRVIVNVSPSRRTDAMSFRAAFEYNGIPYSLKLTDPAITLPLSHIEGDHEFNKIFACVSLAAPFDRDNNRCHKLLAGMIRA
jgi:hypothetical protein